MEKIIKSHVQMPKFLLKKFEDKNGFCYFDVEKKIIGTKGFAKSTNRIKNYYSVTIENILNHFIEQPFSCLINKLEKIEIGKEPFRLSKEESETVKLFLRSLIARSPAMLRAMKNKFAMFQFKEERAQHDSAFLFGMNQANNFRIFDDYIFTFITNTTTVPFVLPISGVFEIKNNGKHLLMLPISPKVAMIFVHKNQENLFLDVNGDYCIFFCDDEQQIINYDLTAFSSQCKSNWGRVVSSDKTLLEKLLDLYVAH